MFDILNRLTASVLATLDVLMTLIAPPSSAPDHRDPGDERDFDVVASGLTAAERAAIEPVIGVAPTDRVVRVLERGVEIGDFEINPDGSLQPVVPRLGGVNHTWVQVLLGELLIATGRDPDAPEMADVPRKLADLIRTMVE